MNRNKDTVVVVVVKGGGGKSQNCEISKQSGCKNTRDYSMNKCNVL